MAASSLVLCLVAAFPPQARAYSVLTHEQLIDLTWQQSIAPLLRARYPGITPQALEQARAYAYGGCVIQDIGYYPFGDRFFSDLTHYVRSGDFVVNLFRNAQNADEFAFAIGALSHYMGDTIGHSQATNIAVPVEFPKLAARYGDSVSYAESPHAHVQTEFAFDINEIVHHRFAPIHYLREVGLKVPVRQLSAAFYQTYGLSEDFSAGRLRIINVRGYRFAVHNFLPRIAYAVTLLHRGTMPADTPSADLSTLTQEIDQVAADNHWDQFRRQPGIGTYTLAGVLYILPKVGPLALLSIKGPTVATEQEYIRSVDLSADALRAALTRFGSAHQTLPNRDLDTGAPTRPGSYSLADQTYAKLLQRVTADTQHTVPPGLKGEVQQYFTDPALSSRHFKAATEARIATKLQKLAAMPVSNQPMAAETE